MNNTKRNTDESLLKNLAIPLVLGAVCLLTFKFIMWNSWKVDQAWAMVGKIKKAKAAVNLSLAKGGHLLLRKSFVFNLEGNYYIINHFDISPYITTDSEKHRLLLTVRVNGKGTSGIPVHGFEKVNIIECDGHYFVFISGQHSIEDFLRLRETVRDIIAVLKKREREKFNESMSAMRILRR